MNATQELLGALSAHFGGKSDGWLAREYFKIATTKVSPYRRGVANFSDARVLEVCETLWPGDDTQKKLWLVRLQADREQNVQVRKVWEAIAKNVAAVVLALTAAAVDVRSHSQATAAPSELERGQSIYYAQWVRLLRWLRGVRALIISFDNLRHLRHPAPASL